VRHRYLLPIVVALGLSIGLIRTPEPVAACGMAPPLNGHVDISDESAIIVWDSKAKVEHFVRTALFTSTSSEFGFLVPTPTQPDLGEVKSDAFFDLGRVTAPRVEHQKQKSSGGCGLGSSKSSTFSAEAPGLAGAKPDVKVLAEKRVGDYDTVSLQATNAPALRKWLLDHNYDARPELESWLKIYTELKWVITAFKISADATARKPAPGVPISMQASAIRMSFSTDRPFYPYREPLDQQQVNADGKTKSRLLRVFMIADARYDGRIGETGAWPGRPVYSKALEKASATESIENLKLKEPAALELKDREWTLTEYEDRSSPRPGTDEVFFSRSPDQSTLERPSHVIVDYEEDDTPGLIGSWPFAGIIGSEPLLFLVRSPDGFRGKSHEIHRF